MAKMGKEGSFMEEATESMAEKKREGDNVSNPAAAGPHYMHVKGTSAGVPHHMDGMIHDGAAAEHHQKYCAGGMVKK